MTEENVDPELVEDLDTDDGDDIEPVELPEYDHAPFAELPEDFDEDYDGEDWTGWQDLGYTTEEGVERA